MSPFRSRSQMKAAFSGALGQEMHSKAKQWAAETPSIKSLPKKKSTAKKSVYHENGGMYRKDS